MSTPFMMFCPKNPPVLFDQVMTNPGINRRDKFLLAALARYIDETGRHDATVGTLADMSMYDYGWTQKKLGGLAKRGLIRIERKLSAPPRRVRCNHYYLTLPEAEAA